MKTVGIIGGLGPETSAKFYLEIVSGCLGTGTQRPPILLWNIPLPFKIEEDLLIKNTGEKRYIPFLIEAAKTLERGGADFLVMPCNTMHIFIKEIRRAVKIPMLSIVDETIAVILKQNISKVGILATTITIKQLLLQNQLRLKGIRVVIPNQKQQQRLDKIIHNLVMGKCNSNDKVAVRQLIKELKNNGIKNIVLACTDLQLIIDKGLVDVKILDTMKILADATANKINDNLSSV